MAGDRGPGWMQFAILDLLPDSPHRGIDKADLALRIFGPNSTRADRAGLHRSITRLVRRGLVTTRLELREALITGGPWGEGSTRRRSHWADITTFSTAVSYPRWEQRWHTIVYRGNVTMIERTCDDPACSTCGRFAPDP